MPTGISEGAPPPNGRLRRFVIRDPLVLQLPEAARNPRQLAAVKPHAAATRADVDRNSRPGRSSQRSGTSRTLHRRLPPRSRTGRTTDPEPQPGVRHGTPGLHRSRPLSRMIASTGSTCSSAKGCGRAAHRQVLPDSPAWTPFPARARGVPRRSSRVPPGPAISRDTGRRCPRRRRRGSVPGAARRIVDSPCSGPLSVRAHQIKRPLVAINHEGSRSEGFIPLGEAGPP
jgi:hypothetical protein